MGKLAESLDKAVEGTFTRPVPKSAGAQMRYLVRQLKGTRPVADLLGISQRTVERYVKGQLKRPRTPLATRIDREVRKRWQPQIRARAKKQAATTGGIVLDTRARFGYTAAPGTTDDARLRHITQALPPQYAARLFDAQAQGGAEQQLLDIAAEGLQEIYFKDRGRRAQGLLVEFTDIDYIEVDL
ncbi:XRE family transcriptional regulator [Streptomyces sp. NEAU-YJ-81]|uniref:telomere-protecting terminal protein Tpg n=1 Tax=Streptomyces sp. NEAU-YJ-81 TaxID=2820288 RepID=UPI001ABCC279|nr:XRE family transcriptional regulator [Streptomyces sp. NEAU-YJ-81]MBO3675734.1 XRE family transcriptional regulator [Streptomyces sp. NEAU-YJ-81]